MPTDIKWLGHASFRLSDGKIKVYVDPYQIAKPEQADLILVTHCHYDHCSPDDVKKLLGPNTLVVSPSNCADKFAGLALKHKAVAPGQEFDAAGLRIRTVHAYNLNKQFHPKANNWVGYIVNIDKEKVYHAGDTDAIPEMKGLEVDVALLPVGGTYTMTAEEAAQAFKQMKVKRAVPMHYGTVVGKKEDGERFLKLVSKK